MKHGHTGHGHPCCGEAGQRPSGMAIARCGGPRMCNACSTAASLLHSSTVVSSPQEEVEFLQSMPSNVYEMWRAISQDPRDPLALLRALAAQKEQIRSLELKIDELVMILKQNGLAW